MPGLPGPREPLGQLGGVEIGQDQEVTDVQDARRMLENRVEIGGDEARVGTDGVDEPPVLAPRR